jgi:hypothetical protein
VDLVIYALLKTAMPLDASPKRYPAICILLLLC